MIYIDAEHLSDGLYNIKDGHIFKYKPKGGTVRVYKMEHRPQGEWIPVSERLPKIKHNVLLSATNGEVFVGYRDKPDLIWQVTEVDGRKHWVYDPEAYTNDIDSLPKGEDCGFSRYTTNGYVGDGMLSVTSLNYDERWSGVTAWMPLPKPYGEREGE